MIRRTRSARRQKGQAIVEFALSATLIFFMMSAAVDLGMVFLTYQGMISAAQEGVSFGSRWWDRPDELKARVMAEAGPVNTADDEDVIHKVNAIDTYKLRPDKDIKISYTSNPMGPGASCPQIEVCDIIVTVDYYYVPFFFLAPLVLGDGNGDKVPDLRITARRTMTLHDISGVRICPSGC